MSDLNLEPDENGYFGPSKSQVKRDMLALVDLGKQLIDLSDDKLRQLKFEDKLHSAIKDAQHINAREGKRRQIHYVGKLLRNEDADAIRKQLDLWENGSKEQARAMHRVEALRDLLIRDDEALTEFFDTYGQANVQEFRTLVRSARREAKQNEALPEGREPSRKHFRSLFQAIKTIVA
ncbi:DUF615 domain-containing protein [Paenalcaligenes niemegkensis]|uniref:ribosome biogenesis factor YjgA n=1 Tax=Paenalcaligenes niemegkensis TaxID=2895469 RepID=UPI001EE89641|nr:ribosome biogenesis factor YjgA [Paenalcaligenes niemegkensis]MCQ9615421.1 DUF615 domain-containing protein [Paenalcaligenes niemegkensis]